MVEMDFEKAIESMRDFGYLPNPDLVTWNNPGKSGKDFLMRGIKYFCGDGGVWQPEYYKVADWLDSNEGRGLLCYGDCGRGKTLLCGKIIPLVVNHIYRKVISCYDAKKINRDINEIMTKKLIYLDDIGVENESVKFGERRQCFVELVDEAEKSGKLLILTTNLSIEQLADKYGLRTIDRLRAITKTVLFQGESLRR